MQLVRLLFAGGEALVADSEEKLCGLVSEFGGVCEGGGLEAGVG